MNAMADSQRVTMSSPADRKVALFRALFRGREDVYARRFESAKSGKKGYSPVCEVEWTRGLCDKRRVACALCPNRRFRPLSDAAVEAHLRGHDAAGRPFVLGVYPLLADDSVRFAAIDFDKASWRSDSASVCEARNALIVRDVLANVREGRSPVVISERKSHLVEIRRALEGKVDHLLLLTGGMGRKAAKAARAEIEAIPASESRVLLATGSYLGEGFDDARLDTLMLALPISWRGRLTQHAGRLHRLRDGKREVRVYDYVDMRVRTVIPPEREPEATLLRLTLS